MGAAQQQVTAEQMNAFLRNQIVQLAIEDRQQIYTNTLTNPYQQTVTVPVRQVGLLLGFFVEVTATITNLSGAAITPTDFGAMNMFESIIFTDPNNNQRIQTDSKHIAMINQVRGRGPYMSVPYSAGNIAGSQATSGWDLPSALGPNWSPWYATPSIAASGTGTVKAIFYIPISYSKNDLRGSIYAGLVNATMQLQFVFTGLTKSASVASGDSTNAIYTGNAGATISSATMVVTQHYYDQLPVIGSGPSANQPSLPLIDTNTAYELKATPFQGLLNGQDFALPFGNYRSYLSNIFIYNDGTSSNGGRPKQAFNTTPNVNYMGLQTASFYYPLKTSAQLQAGLQRNVSGADLPPGTYYFSFRDKPIITTQQGNQQLVVNPANLGSTQTPYIQNYLEDMAIQAVITQAGSLASS